MPVKVHIPTAMRQHADGQFPVAKEPNSGWQPAAFLLTRGGSETRAPAPVSASLASA